MGLSRGVKPVAAVVVLAVFEFEAVGTAGSGTEDFVDFALKAAGSLNLNVAEKQGAEADCRKKIAARAQEFVFGFAFEPNLELEVSAQRFGDTDSAALSGSNSQQALSKLFAGRCAAAALAE